MATDEVQGPVAPVLGLSREELRLVVEAATGGTSARPLAAVCWGF